MNPTAAAVPVTDALHARYLAWLQHEHWAALREHSRRESIAHWRPGPDNYEPTAEAFADRVAGYGPQRSWWMGDAPDLAAAVASAPASSRAAVILDATCAVDDIGALAVAVSAITDGAGALDEERTRAVYVLSCMAVAAWRQLDTSIETGVIRDVRGRA